MNELNGTWHKVKKLDLNVAIFGPLNKKNKGMKPEKIIFNDASIKVTHKNGGFIVDR